jgi:NDP-sugar pyrophosphorylase family protein
MSEPDYSAFFDIESFAQKGIFKAGEPVWNVLPAIGQYLQQLSLDQNHAKITGSPVIRGPVYVGKGSRIDPGVFIQGPAWIGENVHIRHGAYLRGNVIVGDGCVLGNSCEFKNCVLLNDVQVPHYSYVGDSILGSRCHLGAGVICSNLRTDQSEITVEWEGKRYPTGIRKFGVIAGDDVEVGCQAVLNPGTVLGKKSWIHPGVIFAGSCPAESRIVNRNIQKWR